MIDYSSTARSKVKNLTINGYCEMCKKPKSWNGTLVMGAALGEGAQEVPVTCHCQWNTNIASTYVQNIVTAAATHIMINKAQYTAIVAENEQLRARIAELEKHAIHNAVDDVFLPDAKE